jgi:hypothetical protein
VQLGQNWLLRENPEQRILIVVLLFVVALSVLNGCAGVVTTSNPAATGQQASFQLSSSSISFGSIAVGKQSTQTVSVTNSGLTALNITQAIVSNSQFSISGLTTPLALAVGQSSSFTVAVNPNAAGSLTGTMTVTGNSGSSPVVANLSATAVSAQPQLSIGSSPISFGTVAAGSKGTASLVLNNSGGAPLTVSSIAVSGTGFSLSGVSTPDSIAAGQSAQATVTFAPTAAGNDSGVITITSNDPTHPTLTVTLSGTASAASAQLSASPSTLAFGNVNAGSSSSKLVTLTNSGNESLTISSLSVNATNFTTSGLNLPLTLGAGKMATLNILFGPGGSESVSGNITVETSQGTSAVIAVSGTGVQQQPALTITPSGASFGDVSDGSSSTQTIQLKNSGTGTLSVTQASVSGSAFTISGLTLPISLTAGQSSSFTVKFAPQSAGTQSGTVSVASNAPASPTVVDLSGTGMATTLSLSLSSSTLNFGNVNSGSSSALAETITNTGNGNVQILSIAESGSGFTLAGVSVPATLKPGQTLTFDVNFAPATGGNDSGKVTVTSNATGSPGTIVLSGTGVAKSYSVDLAWTASTSTVSGYNVYRSTTNGSSYEKINGALVASVSYADNNVQSGTTYYYVTTSVDSGGNESGYSNQATAVVP